MLDVGCGDFNIGSQLYEYTKKYIAIDVVDELIYRNKLKYKSINLEFYVLDSPLETYLVKSEFLSGFFC